MTTFYRAHFLDALVQSLPPSRANAHFKKRCISYSQELPTSQVTMLFADGTSAKADALIACDGIHSIIRTQMYRDEGDADLVKISQPLWSGRVVYRILIEAEKLKKVNPSHRVLTKPQVVSSPSHIPDK